MPATNQHPPFLFLADNTCSSAQQITASSVKRCAHVSNPSTAPYNSTVAEHMSRFASFAYTKLEARSNNQIKAVLQTYIGSSYQVKPPHC